MKVSLKRAAGLNSADFANACIPLSTAKSAGLAQGATLHPLQHKRRQNATAAGARQSHHGHPKYEFEYTNRAGESGPAPGTVPGAPMKQFDLVLGGENFCK